MSDSDELILFSDDDNEPIDSNVDFQWGVLIVDDENEIHRATKFVFQDFEYLNRSLNFFSAYSAKDAINILRKETDIACILLDVVMETTEAGLELAEYIRNKLCNEKVRIILRTGQPGYAPKLDVMKKYDINDYKDKVSLTHLDLQTSMIGALRSYRQILTIEESRQGLEMVINASARLLSIRSLKQFAFGALKQICSLIKTMPEGIVCASISSLESNPEIIAGAGCFSTSAGMLLTDVFDDEVILTIEKVAKSRESFFNGKHSYIFVPVDFMRDVVIIINNQSDIKDLDRKLLELFVINISICFDNIKMYQEVETLAYYDPLTELPNRFKLINLLSETIKICEYEHVLALIDVDGFGLIQDGLGNEIGNCLLVSLARKLAEIKSISTLARVSPDVFAAIIPLRHGESADDALKPLDLTLNYVEYIKGNSILLRTTLGATTYRGSGDAEAILANAGIALKSAKKRKRGSYELFTKDMNNALQTQLSITNQLQGAEKRGEFFLVYQPQMRLLDDQIIGVETLLRWEKDGVLIPPDKFIPISENSGLIATIGYWVLENALCQQKKWRDKGYNIQLAVNVSPRELQEDDYIANTISLLEKYDTRADQLELEITETALMYYNNEVLEKLFFLQELGINIAIDDFGTGYSSFGQLKKLPVDKLKIDRVFIQDIEKKRENAKFASMIINIGHEIGISVLAEGIENEEQLKILKSLNCNEGQGYFYGKPVSANKIELFYDEKKSALNK